MLDRVKTAVVGCGAISDIYLQNLKNRFRIIDLVGCCDLNMERCTAMAQKYAIRAMSMQDILEDASIELVINLTAPQVHYSVIRQLLEGGKHVYTEKVLAVELEQARQLVALANEKQLYLGAAPDTFLGAAVQKARLALDNGLIGKVTSCVAQTSKDYRMLSQRILFVTENGGGIGFGLGVYYVTALLSILGPVEKVSGMLHHTAERWPINQPGNPRFGEEREVQPETILAGTLRFRSGVIGSIQFNSEGIAPEQPVLMLCGTEGTLYMADPNRFGGEVYYRAKGSDARIALPESFGYAENSRGLGAAEMAWAMRLGRKNRANKDIALHALEVLHGIARSSENDRAYVLQSDFELPCPLPRGYMDGYLKLDAEAALAI